MNLKIKVKLINELKLLLILKFTLNCQNKVKDEIKNQDISKINYFRISKVIKSIFNVPRGGYLSLQRKSSINYKLVYSEINYITLSFDLDDYLTILEQQEFQDFIKNTLVKLKSKRIIQSSLKTNYLATSISNTSKLSKVENILVSWFGALALFKIAEFGLINQNLANLNVNHRELQKIEVLAKCETNVENPKSTTIICLEGKGYILTAQKVSSNQQIETEAKISERSSQDKKVN